MSSDQDQAVADIRSPYEYAVLTTMVEGRVLVTSEPEVLVTLKGESDYVDLRRLAERSLIREITAGHWRMTMGGQTAHLIWSTLYGDRWELERDG